MTVPASTEMPAAAAARSILQLVLGRGEPRLDDESWRAVATLAVRECCGPLIWHRAGAVVRAGAPADVLGRLRGHAIQQALVQQGRLAQLRDVLGRLAAEQVDAVVLKGMALSRLLYDDPFVRPSADVDLWVPLPQREQARHVLLSMGWRLAEGHAPFEEVFGRRAAQEYVRLEVHSYLLGDMLAHLPDVSAARLALDVDGSELHALSRPLQAVTLATHLAGHRVFPLLFAIDWYSLWNGMTTAERDTATMLARELRADRYLGWARDVASNVDRGCATDGPGDLALRALGFGSVRVTSGNPALRALRLARTSADRRAVVSSWLLPPHLPREPLALARASAARLGRRLRALRSPTSDASRQLRTRLPADVPTIPVTDQALAALVARRGREGEGTMWVRATGDSMQPSIPSGALVRLRATAPVTVQSGDVVLARLPDGRVVLHRVVALDAKVMRLRGDGNIGSDPVVPRDAVVAIADMAMLGGRSLHVGRRARVSVGVALRRAWVTARRGVTRQVPERI